MPSLTFASSVNLLPPRRKSCRSSSRVCTRASLSPASSPSIRSLLPPDAAVLATDSGDEVNLLDAVEALAPPVLIGWLRHYGCTLCKKQVSDWKALSERAQIVLIGNGTAAQAGDFSEELNLAEYPAMALYSDPSRSTYAALNFSKGLSSVFTPPSLLKTIASFRSGNTQTWSRLPTDAFQQGGALVVDESGLVRFLHRDRFAGDHAPIYTLEDAIEQAKIPLVK